MIKYATVTSVTPFKVKFDIDGTESANISYKRLVSYPAPAVGDRVVFLFDGKNILCLGKVV